MPVANVTDLSWVGAGAGFTLLLIAALACWVRLEWRSSDVLNTPPKGDLRDND